MCSHIILIQLNFILIYLFIIFFVNLWVKATYLIFFLIPFIFSVFLLPYDLSESNTPSQCLFVIFYLYCIALSFVNIKILHEMKRSDVSQINLYNTDVFVFVSFSIPANTVGSNTLLIHSSFYLFYSKCLK